jgi:hypothetical protein
LRYVYLIFAVPSRVAAIFGAEVGVTTSPLSFLACSAAVSGMLPSPASILSARPKPMSLGVKSPRYPLSELFTEVAKASPCFFQSALSPLTQSGVRSSLGSSFLVFLASGFLLVHPGFAASPPFEGAGGLLYSYVLPASNHLSGASPGSFASAGAATGLAGAPPSLLWAWTGPRPVNERLASWSANDLPRSPALTEEALGVAALAGPGMFWVDVDSRRSSMGGLLEQS